MENNEKIRLDVLVSQKESISRTMAQSFIEQGFVKVDEKIITSSSAKVDINSEIITEKPKDLFVSRAGNKLKFAIDEFNIDVENKICLDVGASTGGFTECLLKYGASKVYAVDTGTEQLHESLRQHLKVMSMEKTNINDVNNLPDKPEILVIDVSFVSLKKVFLSALNLVHKNAEIICLIKPQFEAGRENLTKKGIVKDKKIHNKILNDFRNYFSSNGLNVVNLIESPLKGGNGNTEFLIYLKRKLD
ncbi:MAG: TlyA family RNA methyltransferase [Defluviitaleaceae bacterium]|nr:TlyA family RNA methyltransferase [Defluviitaleaceae bacterium]